MTQGEDHEGPIVHDRRRIDPVTGKVRQGARPADTQPADTQPADAREPGPAQRADREPGTSEPEEDAEVARLQRALDERTNDIKRLQAEYVNYKRRVDRDREAVRELAVGAVLTELLPVVDDIGRAREHGELEGGFKAVSEALEGILAKLGLVRFGEVGEPFDPRVHEALMHAYDDDLDGPTCSAILQPGYRQGERILRPARVAVAEPTVGLPPRPAAEAAEETAADEATDDAGGAAESAAADGSGADDSATTGESGSKPGTAESRGPGPAGRPSEGDE